MHVLEIIAPVHDNAGAPLTWEHEEVRQLLTEYYGGFTTWRVEGRWMDERTRASHYDQSQLYRAWMLSTADVVTVTQRVGVLLRQMAIAYTVDGVPSVDNVR